MTLIIFPCMNLDLEGLHDFDHFFLHEFGLDTFAMLTGVPFHFVVIMLLAVDFVLESSFGQIILYLHEFDHVETCDICCVRVPSDR